MLKIERVTKKFGPFTAVNGLNLDVKKGEIMGIVGSNGAGKTTTFRMILGLIEPTAGNLTWNGEKINHTKSHLVGYLPEERGLYPKLKVEEQLLYFARLRGMKKEEALPLIEQWLEKFEMTQHKSKKASELSKGNQQKIQFIYTVLHQPELLILDEPFSGLDPINVEMLKRAILEVKEQGTTILFSTHRMEHVEELCERIAIFKKGRIIEQGFVKDIRRKYGKQYVYIETENPLNEETLQNFSGVESIEKTTNGYKLKIIDEHDAQNILKTIANTHFIRKFELEEPSLNEIFIHTVGEAYE